MADVDIVAQLDDKQITAAITSIVNSIDREMGAAAKTFDKHVETMETRFAQFAGTTIGKVKEIKQSFLELGVAFDSIADAIKRAAENRANAGVFNTGSGTPFAPNTVGELEQIISAENKRRREMELGSDELRKQNALLEQQKKTLHDAKMSDSAKDLVSARKELQAAFSMPSRQLTDAEAKLARLNQIAANFRGKGVLDEAQWNRLNNQIQATQERITRLQQRKPLSFNDVMGMDQSSISAITQKMAALRNVQIDPNNAKEVQRLAKAYRELGQLQSDMMGRNVQLGRSNSVLAQSFNYIRNRLIYALTIGAFSTFIGQLYQVRGEYELLERSLGILADDMRRGSEMFTQLNEMALKSPFTLVELATGAKQLLAYNFAEEEVVDTTKRLADISAALGVPMERLVYNLGQIRAQTVLTARDARDFANAGLAIVPMLAQMYTEQKRFGDEVVTTRDVFDMMSKKLVSYADVMQVINKVTDEGGKFFDYQAKQADTLKVRLANLKLAWNNMLNDIGKANQSALAFPLNIAKYAFENWRSLARVIQTTVLALGAYKVAAILADLYTKRLAIGQTVVAFIQMTKWVRNASDAMKLFNMTLGVSPIGVIVGAMAALVGYFVLFNNKTDEAAYDVERFGKAGAKAVKEAEDLFQLLTLTSRESSNYSKVMQELNSILGEYHLEQIKESDTLDIIDEKRKRSIALIKEEAAERKYLNDIQQGRDAYEEAVEKAKDKLRKDLSDATTSGLFVTATPEIRDNANAITNIIANTVEADIDEIANRTGEEYEKGMSKILDSIEAKMRSIGLSERAITSTWKDTWGVDVVNRYIQSVREAKEEQDRFTESIEKAHAEEEKAADASLTFNDRIQRTSESLNSAANDTDKFYAKIDQLVKDYTGENIINFLVKVRAEVPKWMMDKSYTELSKLASRFTAIATEAKKANKETANVNGETFTVQDLFTKASLYAEAAKQKVANEEANKSSKIVQAASDALKDYKTSLEALATAKRKVQQGSAEQVLVTQKETEVQKNYNKALAAGVSEQELLEAKNGKKGRGKGGSKKDEFGETLQNQIQLISELQKSYKSYLEWGYSKQEALTASSADFGASLAHNNAILQKYGVSGLTGSDLASMDLHDLQNYYETILIKAQSTAKGTEAVEKAIKGIRQEIAKLDSQRIVEGLNSTLSRVKEEYDLGVEFDANPELGEMFADMIGISEDRLSELPRNYHAVIERLQQGIDENVGEGIFNLEALLNKGDFEKWVESSGKSLKAGFITELDKLRQYAVKLRLDETKSQIAEWDKLLDKYAEYETKRRRITEQAEHDRQVAIANGADSEILDAIENSKRRQLARVDFEQFQQLPTWITATGDLSTLTDKALSTLIERIKEYKKSAKYLEPKQIKEINKALRQLYKEQHKGNPFLVLKEALMDAKERFDDYQVKIDEAGDEIDRLKEKEGQWTKEETTRFVELIDQVVKFKKEQKEVSKTPAEIYVDAINAAIAIASKATGVFKEMADAIGGEKLTFAAETLSKAMSVLDRAGQGAAAGAQWGAWGAAIGAVAGALTGAITMFADEISGNKRISDRIEKSERAVRKLEVAYNDLQHQMERAYGMESIGLQRILILNKEVQLAELERQLTLEQSRKSKNRDEDKILDLQDKVNELRNEITDDIQAITNDLLGISGVGDAVENTITSMIDAFKNGEDYMEAFDKSFDDMIDNMIVKALMGTIIGKRIEDFVKEAEEMVTNRATETAQAKSYQSQIEQARESLEAAQRDMDAAEKKYLNAITTSIDHQALDRYRRDFNEKGSVVAQMQANLDRLQAEYEQYVAQGTDVLTPQDIAEMRAKKESLQEGVKEEFLRWMDAFGIQQGEDADTQELSALQQGIQGVTETTANALEAYMNGISQQVYLHSALLTEIRDMLLSTSADVQMGIQAQMLLQLQQSYQVQMSIRGLMENWTSPAGNAVQVQLL